MLPMGDSTFWHTARFWVDINFVRFVFLNVFSISKICIHLIPPREIAYIVTVIKKEWHEIQSYQTQGINGSTLQVTGLLVFILQNRLRLYRTYTVWQYFHRFLCDTQRNLSKQKLQQNLICKNWFNCNVRYNIV